MARLALPAQSWCNGTACPHTSGCCTHLAATWGQQPITLVLRSYTTTELASSTSASLHLLLLMSRHLH